MRPLHNSWKLLKYCSYFKRQIKVKNNKTKIVATLGPASNSPEKIKQLIKCGVNVFRLNFSHGTHADHKISHANIRNAAKDLGKIIGILLDLQGPKIRVGVVKDICKVTNSYLDNRENVNKIP